MGFKKLLLTLCLLLPAPVKAETVEYDPARTVWLVGPIMSFTAFPVQVQLLGLKDTPGPAYLFINSPGGSVDAGRNIINAMDLLKSTGHEVVCVVVGKAYSMAFFIYNECDKRYALETATMLWHPMSVSFDPDESLPVYKLAENLSTMRKEEVEMLAKLLRNLRIPRQTFLDAYFAETTWTAPMLKHTAPGYFDIVTTLKTLPPQGD